LEIGKDIEEYSKTATVTDSKELKIELTKEEGTLVIIVYARLEMETILRIVFGNVDKAMMDNAIVYFIIMALCYLYFTIYRKSVMKITPVFVKYCTQNHVKKHYFANKNLIICALHSQRAPKYLRMNYYEKTTIQE
jgi:hypothetical protein